jgi:hypothetical protein
MLLVNLSAILTVESWLPNIPPKTITPIEPLLGIALILPETKKEVVFGAL